MQATQQPGESASRASRLAGWSLGLGIASLLLTPIIIGGAFILPAIVCGHVARAKIKRSGGVLTGKGRALAGLIMGYLSIGTVGVMILITSAAATLNEAERANACIAHLRAIDTAKESWVLDHKKAVGDLPTWEDLKPSLREEPKCPKGGEYKINAVGTDPECNIPGHKMPR